MASLQDPLACLQAYLIAFIQEDNEFFFSRQSITRINQITSAKPVACRFSPLNNCLLVRQEANSLKSYSLNNFDQIQWGQLDSNSKVKYINISLKNDKNPIVLHGSTEIMELWFDGLKLILNSKNIENPGILGEITNSSLDKIDIFTKALSHANINRNSIFEIPPPPPNFHFDSNF